MPPEPDTDPNSVGLNAARHRTDIDGLRAVAIVPVLLYHMEWESFGGGFVGVDVFFVISGFLITGVVAREISKGTFSITGFYARRAKRILPALFVVLGATSAVGFALLGPSELKDLGKGLSSAALSASNIVFWRSTGYFVTAAELKPLLMTWSLGVEEQFYVLWPLALTILLRRRTLTFAVVGLIAMGSFLLSAWWVVHKPASAFYLLPARGWELLLGAVLALLPVRNGRPVGPAQAHLLSLAGLALIAVSVLAFDAATPFPGPAALAPCFGTAALLWSGERAFVNRVLLSSKPLVFIGLISYSLYLWHWPLFSFVRILHLGALPRTPAMMALACAFALAVLTWKFVETPLRRSTTTPILRVLWRYGAVTCGFAFLGGALWITNGVPSRLPVAVVLADSARFDVNPLRDACHDSPPAAALANPSCAFGPSGVGQVVALWGDSHADALSPGVLAWAIRAGFGFVQITTSACPPLADVKVVRAGRLEPGCAEWARDSLGSLIADPRIGIVVLAARWTIYTEAARFGVESGDPLHLADGVSQVLSRDNSRRVFAASLVNVATQLTRAHKSVLIVGQVPEVGFDVPDCLVRSHMPFGATHNCTVSSTLVARRMGFTTRTIESVARSQPGVRTFFPAHSLCDEERCITASGDIVLYVDDDHLSRAGALYLSERLAVGVDIESWVRP